MKLTQMQLQHLYLRTGFGLSPALISSKKNTQKEELVIELLQKSKPIRNIELIPSPLGEDNTGEVTNFKLALMLLRSQKELRKVGLEWLNRMATAPEQLRERMTFFWHNHFATRLPFGYLMQLQNNTLRKHALGSFSDMLLAIAKDPAMMLFLNTFENKKNAPNENFAREVMELFTLGEGNYTEKDVKEAARCFTGWKVDRRGQFYVEEKEHDNGEKTIFGKTGNFTGEDVLRMILKQKQTARFICRKIYKEFVNPVVNEDRLAELADVFYSSEYNIESVISHLLYSEWFYNTENIGVKIASPVDLLVRYMQLFHIHFEDPKIPSRFMQLLGQELFFPPNVAGWSGDKNWIDSTTLLLRMRIPLVLFKGQPLRVKIKTANEDNAMDETDGKPDKDILQIRSDWGELVQYFQAFTGKETDLLLELKRTFLQQPAAVNDTLLLSQAERFSSEALIKSLTTSIMCLPEFHLT